MTKLTKNILGIAIVIGSFAGLTKAGFIPNYLDLKILCSETQEEIDDDSDYSESNAFGKPIIYLYPEQKQEIFVQLDYKGELFATYPDYNEEIKGWEVTAFPNGDLINHADKKEYSYLFWEGYSENKIDWDLSTGFVVKGSDTKKFLQKKLSEMGLTPREYNEFIVYWFPKMQNNTYNVIHFAEEQYTDTAPLKITPKPDSLLRIFMVFKGINSKNEVKEITPQKTQLFKRKGFSVVEWGGTEIQ